MLSKNQESGLKPQVSRTFKSSELGPQTKLMCFDIETNGLHGEAFAVAGLVMRADGEVLEEFKARCPVKGDLDPWVEENVLPVLDDFPPTHKTAKALRNAFWQWYQQVEPQTDYVLVNNGYPVEYRFLTKCQEDDLEVRYWEHPFPILELASLLLPLGIKTQGEKKDFASDLIGDRLAQSHNPYWDAWLTAAIAFKALKVSGQLA